MLPAWSPAIANNFIRLASADGVAFDQMQLQELVYIAQGWCLALTGQPLTGDRPEAFEHGPEYRRLADALAKCGLDPVRNEISSLGGSGVGPKTDAIHVDEGGLVSDEYAILSKVYIEYGKRSAPELAVITRAPGTPWAGVYAGGAGAGRDINHELIRLQFANINDEFSA